MLLETLLVSQFIRLGYHSRHLGYPELHWYGGLKFPL